ncbi:MAG: 30S ribosomal protein S4 [Parcubacteria group bacterium]|nr:30S ribosomal protein S4 [Parcubacteria group bacterium]
MIIGPKYKIARRLGAPVFEKTQNQKFVLSLARRGKPSRGKKGPRQRTDYGAQMTEKQKARYTYLIGEKQFSNYVKKAIADKSAKTVDLLFRNLETRLDSIVFRLGFANTRSFSRQMISHGHIVVNGKRVDIPSAQIYLGDKISIKEGSLKKNMFIGIDDRLKNHTVPSWIKFDFAKKEAEIQGMPKLEQADLLFDLNAVLEFYSR